MANSSSDWTCVVSLLFCLTLCSAVPDDVMANSEHDVSALDLCNLDHCSSEPANVTLLTSFCDVSSNRTMLNHRCCTESVNLGGEEEETVIVGLDLSGCQLADLDILHHEDVTNFHRELLEFLVVDDNPLENCTSAGDYSGMSRLRFLSLPGGCTCPGGGDAWNVTSSTADSVLCRGLRDLCSLLNVTCPANSHCHLNSPGVTWCNCDNGYHGYKCLRYGTFPSQMAGILLAGGTVVMTTVCWFSFRRKVKVVKPAEREEAQSSE